MTVAVLGLAAAGRPAVAVQFWPMDWIGDPLVVLIVTVLVLCAALLAAYSGWTAARLDRLYGRVGAAGDVLDAELIRRAAAARSLGGDGSPLAAAAVAALRAAGPSRAADPGGPPDWESRAVVENELSTELRNTPVDNGGTSGGVSDAELLTAAVDAARRVTVARQVYNDVVRDTRTLRERRLVRLLRLSGDRSVPVYFDIAEVVPAGSAAGQDGAGPAAMPVRPEPLGSPGRDR